MYSNVRTNYLTVNALSHKNAGQKGHLNPQCRCARSGSALTSVAASHHRKSQISSIDSPAPGWACGPVRCALQDLDRRRPGISDPRARTRCARGVKVRRTRRMSGGRAAASPTYRGYALGANLNLSYCLIVGPVSSRQYFRRSSQHHLLWE